MRVTLYVPKKWEAKYREFQVAADHQGVGVMQYLMTAGGDVEPMPEPEKKPAVGLACPWCDRPVDVVINRRKGSGKYAR